MNGFSLRTQQTVVVVGYRVSLLHGWVSGGRQSLRRVGESSYGRMLIVGSNRRDSVATCERDTD